MSTSIATIGIVGAGTMGSALAQKFSAEGLSVRLVDREDRFLERGLDGIRATLREGVERRLFTPEAADAVVARIAPSTDYAVLAGCGMVIEAVFEDAEVKRGVFARVAEAVAPDAILATNTSSFSVTDLARAVPRPERFIGLHFFYHAAKNRLVEVVRGGRTDDDTFRRTLLLMQRCGKDPIVCRDAHGFVVNRFFVPWLNEACRLAAEGVAGTAAIDEVFCATFGCGMGPFALMNATGVPIAYHSQRTLAEAFGAFYTPAELLRAQAESGRPWEIAGATALDAPAADKIRTRILGVEFLVCGQLLDEGVCTAGDLNRGARIGLRWRRGPLDLFRRHGEEAVRAFVEPVASRHGVPVPASLREMSWRASYVRTERDGKTGVIVIDRPEDLNALNPEVAHQLGDAFSWLDADMEIETIVLTGTGKAFMAGADISFFLGRMRADALDDIVTFTAAGQALYRRIDESKKTVVALVNGLALGGGLELALAADRIFALPEAAMAFPETGIGIYPGLGGTQRSVRRLGPGLAKYLVYTGSMLSAAQAKEIGLVDAVVSWDDVPCILRGELPAVERAELPAHYAALRDLFDRHRVDDLAGGRVDAAETAAHGKTLKRLRYRAPLALRAAERLIDAQRGPESELDGLTEIFATKDALAGLSSVGKSEPPAFTGA